MGTKDGIRIFLPNGAISINKQCELGITMLKGTNRNTSTPTLRYSISPTLHQRGCEFEGSLSSAKAILLMEQHNKS
jgi:hypothetical protein